MLERIVSENILQVRGVVAFYPANSRSDDILVYKPEDDEQRNQPIEVLHGLRQQAEKDSAAASEPYLCLSDFIAPAESGLRDYIGLFAVSAGFGCQDAVQRCVGSLEIENIINTFQLCLL